MPKWNENAIIPLPLVRYEDMDRLYCRGLTQTKFNIECEIQYSTDTDVVILLSPLEVVKEEEVFDEDGNVLTVQEVVEDF